MVDGPGAAQRLLRRLALRYAAIGRTVIATFAGVLGSIAAPQTWPAIAAVVVVVAWSVAYAWLLTHRHRPWLLVADIAVVAAACLTQRWTVPADALAANQGWVIALASITVVVYQWHTTVPVGLCALVAIDAAFLAGVLLAVPGQTGAALVMVLWLPIEAVLSRLLWILVRRGGERADLLTAQAERARQAEAVAEALRADERAHLASLHDTAASTLLMVGLGEVGKPEPWLRDQARRDLASLGHWPASDGATQDLVPLLRDVIANVPVTVAADLPDSWTAPASVCASLCGAVQEALTNVSRHAGTKAADVRVERSDDQISVWVADQGAGFDPDAIPPSRYGVSESIVARMARVGGRATVTSARGSGTTVRLDWPVP